MSLKDRAIEELILSEMELNLMRERLKEQDDNTMIRAFWGCGDSDIINYAITRARLNANERETLELVLDGCQSQEMAAESMGVSTRSLQAWWKSGVTKILNQPWARAYAAELARGRR